MVQLLPNLDCDSSAWDATRLVTQPQHVRFSYDHNPSSSSLTARQEICKLFCSRSAHLFFTQPPSLIRPIAEASTSTNRKRKRQGSDTENDATGVTDGEDAQEHGQDDDDDADDANAPKSKATRKGKAKVSPKTKGAPAAKKPRTNKGQPKTMGRRGRKVKEGDDAYDAEQVAKDTKIAADNPLFSAHHAPRSLYFSLILIMCGCRCYYESRSRTPIYRGRLSRIVRAITGCCPS